MIKGQDDGDVFSRKKQGNRQLSLTLPGVPMTTDYSVPQNEIRMLPGEIDENTTSFLGTPGRRIVNPVLGDNIVPTPFAIQTTISQDSSSLDESFGLESANFVRSVIKQMDVRKKQIQHDNNRQPSHRRTKARQHPSAPPIQLE